MYKKITFLLVLLFQITSVYCQTNEEHMPKLVVGIVVDQMRFDQLHRYEHRYSERGFKRLLEHGFSFKNTHYNYIPTVTAAGHAAVYTGTTPSVNGIIGNSWYDRGKKAEVENVEDHSEIIIGSKKTDTVGRSPKNLLTTTIADQLRVDSNFRSKVISVSFKDRGAILPGGHTANGAYWYDWKSSPGYFVSSSYYMKELPAWVNKFNELGKVDQYLDSVWNPLYPIESYTLSAPDDNAYERVLRGKETPTFPYDFKEMRKVYRELNAEYNIFWISPWGNTLLTEFAIAAIENEGLGKGKHTDLLNIGYSVTDVVGHTFGPQSVEMEDIYLRLDKDIEKLLDYLDKKVGKDAYVLFLTSDHGAIPVSSFLSDHKLPSEIARLNQYETQLKEFLLAKTGIDSLLEKFDYEQVYLNRDHIKERGLDLIEIQRTAAYFLSNLKGVDHALSAYDLQTSAYNEGIRSKMQKGYHKNRSGDISISFKSGFVGSDDPELSISQVKGTTHGSGWSYDSHVPLVWFGKNIPTGNSARSVAITSIAPTLALLLNLQLPSGSSTEACEELFTTY